MSRFAWITGIMMMVILGLPALPMAVLNQAFAVQQQSTTAKKPTAKSSIRSRMKPEKKEGLFGYLEIHYKKMAGFKKWAQVLERESKSDKDQIRAARMKTPISSTNKIRIPRNFKQSQLSEKGSGIQCSRFNRVKCKREEWDKFISRQQENLKSGKSQKDILDAVNIYMNNTPYIVDPSNWGVPDYWATTTEFFYKDGDCEDYAISKYVTLKRIGFPNQDMRLVVGQDNNSRVEHAILSVKINGLDYILDNQVNAVIPHTKIKHFTPVYAINEHGWWRHMRKKNY